MSDFTTPIVPAAARDPIFEEKSLENPNLHLVKSDEIVLGQRYNNNIYFSVFEGFRYQISSKVHDEHLLFLLTVVKFSKSSHAQNFFPFQQNLKMTQFLSPKFSSQKPQKG